MNFTLTLAFTGLCAFLPHNGDKEMWAFLVDARTAENYCSYALHAHKPRLSFPLRNLEDYCEITYSGGIAVEKCLSKGTATFPGTITVDSQGLHVAQVDLAKETIQIAQPKLASLDLKNTSTNGNLPDEAKGDERDFRWVVGLKDIFPVGSDYAEIDDKCMNDPQNSNLVARLNLTDGQATSERLSFNPNGDYFAWKLHYNGQTREQTLTDQVKVTIPDFHDRVTINFIPFAAFPQLPSRKIVLKAVQKIDLIELGISNLPMPTFSHIGSTGMPQLLPHFAWLYKLSKGGEPNICPVPTTLSPTPFQPLVAGAPIQTLTTNTGGGDVFCPMTRF